MLTYLTKKDFECERKDNKLLMQNSHMSGCQPKICDVENVNVNEKIMQAISGYPLADKDITRDFSPIIA